MAGAGGGRGGGFRIGAYSLDWRNPIHYLIAWVLATLLLLVIAGFAAPLAIAFAAAVAFGTLIGVANLRRG